MKIILDELDTKRMERLNATIQTNSAMAEALLSFVEVNPKYVTINQIQEFVDEYEMLPELAYAMILSTALGFDIHKNNVHQELFQDYIVPGFSQLKAEDFVDDPYLKNIKISPKKFGNLELATQKFSAAEALFFNDVHTTSEFREYPQIGFFMDEIEFPAITENDKTIASVNPLTINTTQNVIENAQGNVLCCGLGMGYFAALSSSKKTVEKITVLENSNDIIDVFNSEILPQIPNGDKIEIINADPLEYIKGEPSPLPYDYIFSDTADLKNYLKLREYNCEFSREKKFLSELRKTVFNQLYSIYQNPTEGGKEIKSYREVVDMISDKGLREVKVKG